MAFLPSHESFDVCRDAWGVYINESLRSLIATGVGKPTPDSDGPLTCVLPGLRLELAGARS